VINIAVTHCLLLQGPNPSSSPQPDRTGQALRQPPCTCWPSSSLQQQPLAHLCDIQGIHQVNALLHCLQHLVWAALQSRMWQQSSRQVVDGCDITSIKPTICPRT
jgi:hypothetical protein